MIKNKLDLILVVICLLLQQTSSIASNNADCKRVVSASEDPTPAQIAGGTLPTITSEITWQRPAIAVYKGNFSGVNGSAASHEGVDYVHNDQSVAEVVIRAAADGKVVYVREGCEQTSMFSHNNTGRESGAGWGNHIVISHKTTIYTRYGHLLKNSILVNVGDSVKAGQVIAIMGNSGRSETRHLHFELGTKTLDFNPCAMSQNFDRVYNSELLNFQSSPSALKYINQSVVNINIAPNPIKNEFRLTSCEEFNNMTNVYVKDITGKQIDCLIEIGRTSNSRNFRLRGIENSGIYFLVVDGQKSRQVLKINIAKK